MSNLFENFDWAKFPQSVANTAQSALLGAAVAGGAAATNSTIKFFDGLGESLGNGLDKYVLDGVSDFLGTNKKLEGNPQQPSINPKTVNVGGLDPIQGYDVGVWVEDKGRSHAPVLLGQFTSILLTVKNASEAYLPVGSRQPIYFDGEIQIAFTLEKGLLDANVFTETFGFKTFDYTNRYYRSPRFKITFAMDPVDWLALNQDSRSLDSYDLDSSSKMHKRWSSGRIELDYCKIDTWHLGAKSGKEVVATQWTGVAQQIRSYTNTLDNFPEGIAPADAYDRNTGKPKDLRNVYTVNYSPAQMSTTDVLPSQKSYDDTSTFTQSQILEATLGAYKQFLGTVQHLGDTNPLVSTAKALISSTERQLAGIKGATTESGKSRNDGATYQNKPFANASDGSEARSRVIATDEFLITMQRRVDLNTKLRSERNPETRASILAELDQVNFVIEKFYLEKSRVVATDEFLITMQRRTDINKKLQSERNPEIIASLKKELDDVNFVIEKFYLEKSRATDQPSIISKFDTQSTAPENLLNPVARAVRDRNNAIAKLQDPKITQTEKLAAQKSLEDANKVLSDAYKPSPAATNQPSIISSAPQPSPAATNQPSTISEPFVKKKDGSPARSEISTVDTVTDLIQQQIGLNKQIQTETDPGKKDALKNTLAEVNTSLQKLYGNISSNDKKTFTDTYTDPSSTATNQPPNTNKFDKPSE